MTDAYRTPGQVDETEVKLREISEREETKRRGVQEREETKRKKLAAKTSKESVAKVESVCTAATIVLVVAAVTSGVCFRITHPSKEDPCEEGARLRPTAADSWVSCSGGRADVQLLRQDLVLFSCTCPNRNGVAPLLDAGTEYVDATTREHVE